MWFLNKKSNGLIFFFLYFTFVFFLTICIKKSKIENEIKFIKVKLNGGKLKIVIPPNTKGEKNKIKNLLLIKFFKIIPN